eukprot:scaffold4266_cov83-Cylindrotheca_fusiformis.AAC.3
MEALASMSRPLGSGVHSYYRTRSDVECYVSTYLKTWVVTWRIRTLTASISLGGTDTSSVSLDRIINLHPTISPPRISILKTFELRRFLIVSPIRFICLTFLSTIATVVEGFTTMLLPPVSTQHTISHTCSHQAGHFHPVNQISSSSRTSYSPLYGIRCEDKFYQLEEREDAETSSTEVYLMKDRQVDFGKTDGPVPDSVEGTWHVEPGTDDFKMTIRRVFGSGNRGSDMGEFQFEILRELRGEMTMVGDSVAITGIIVNKDELLGDKGA